MQTVLGLAAVVSTVTLLCLSDAVVPASDGWPPPGVESTLDVAETAAELSHQSRLSTTVVDDDEHRQTSQPRRRRRRRKMRHSHRSKVTQSNYEMIDVDDDDTAGPSAADCWTGQRHSHSPPDGDRQPDVDSGSHQRLPPSVPELQHLVTSLQLELKESQATQMRTRSIINVMQEKLEAQQRDMAVLKNDVVQLRRDLSAERDLVTSLRSHAADASWAIADVKRGQDQVASDLTVLKRLQDLQNETMIVIEEIIMSNALELVSHNKHAVAVRQDIARLQAQLSDNHDHLQRVHDTLQRHLVNVRGTNYRAVEVNSVDDGNTDDYDNQLPAGDELYASELRLNGVDDSSTDDQSQSLDDRHVITDPAHLVTSLQERLNGMVDEVTELKAQVSTITRNHSRDGSTVSSDALVGAQLLQQAFINFTRHIYQLENDARHRQHEVSDRMPSSSSGVDDWLHQRLSELNASLTETRQRADDDRRRIDDTLDGLREIHGGWDERSRHLEIILLNSSLEHCRRANSELVVDVQLTQLSDKSAALDGKTTQLASAVERAETGVKEVNSELQRHRDALTSLSKQMKLLRHVPLEVATLHDDLLNIIAQFPPDCSEAVSSPTSTDGVHVIRPGLSNDRRTALVYCQRDHDGGPGWTVIQRRTDGRESFSRGWDDYTTGFGDAAGDYWLGNDYIHRLTNRQAFRLRVDMWDVQGRYWVAEYPAFRVASSDELYRLDLGRPPVDEDAKAQGKGEGEREKVSVGNATDALSYSDGQPFSALDRDNDVSTTDCARFYAAGWWYKHCHYANLNGRYTAGMVWFNEQRDEWLQMRQTVMKIAPVTMATSVNNHRTDNKASFDYDESTGSPAPAGH